MSKVIQLKRPITSKKFGVVFPANIDLLTFTDSEGNIFVEHPKTDNVYTQVAKTNIKSTVEEKLFTLAQAKQIWIEGGKASRNMSKGLDYKEFSELDIIQEATKSK